MVIKKNKINKNISLKYLFLIFYKYIIIFFTIILLLIIIIIKIKKNSYYKKLLDIIIYYNFNNHLNDTDSSELNDIDNKFFFELNQNELNYCLNYGLYVYDYHYEGKIDFFNIGDYIQSLAALQYLPKKCKPYLVDRDSIQFYNGTKIKLIMNGWHNLNGGNKYVSNKIKPFYISYHLTKSKDMPEEFIKNMNNFSPIGCRDIQTRNNLIKYGIKAYFSSCLTTTLDIDYRLDKSERTNEIIFIDYKFGDYPEADKYLFSLEAYNFNKITYISHMFDINLTHIERLKFASKLLKRYAKAKLIITTRIHGALPCLALNTPVILINKKFDYDRYIGLYELLNTIGINSKKRFEIRVNINNKGLVYTEIY